MTLVFTGMWAVLFIVAASRVCVPRSARLREHPRLKVFVDLTWVPTLLLLAAGIVVSLTDRSAPPGLLHFVGLVSFLVHTVGSAFTTGLLALMGTSSDRA